MPAWLLTERHNLHTGEGCLLNTPQHMHAKCPPMLSACAGQGSTGCPCPLHRLQCAGANCRQFSAGCSCNGCKQGWTLDSSGLCSVVRNAPYWLHLCLAVLDRC